MLDAIRWYYRQGTYEETDMNTQMHETAATGRGGIGRTLPVHVVDNDGTTARVQVQESGLYLKQGETHTVPSAELRTRN